MSSNLHKALSLYNQGLFEDAEKIITEALKATPKDHNALHLASMILNKMGDFIQALTRIDSALKIDTRNHEMWNTKGNILVNLGQNADAIKSFEKSLSNNPNYTPAQQNLAFLFNKLQAPNRSLPLFDLLIVKNAANSSYILGRAQALIMAERPAEAAKYLDLHQAHIPHDLAQYTKGQALFADGNYAESLKSYTTIPPSSTYHSQALKNSYQILSLTGETEKIKTLMSAHESPASDELVSINIDMIGKLEGVSSARTYVAHKLPKYQDNPFVLSALAKFDIAEQSYEGAFNKTSTALKLASDNNVLLGQNVVAAMGIHEYAHAEKIISRQIKTRPNDQYWIAMLATLQRLQGKNHNYLYDYERFISVFDLSIPKDYSSQSEYLTKLKSTLCDLHEFESEPIDQSLRGGTQTRPNLVHIDNPVITSFFSSINANVKEFVSTLPDDPQHPFLKRKTKHPRIISAWSVRLTGTGFHVNHVHPEGWISSAFYVDVPDGTEKDQNQKGWIKFGEPSFKLPNLEAEHFIAPAAGKLVLFPSYIWHGTVPTADKTFRLTLPFDVLPV